jgi:hypothetical protein
MHDIVTVYELLVQLQLLTTSLIIIIIVYQIVILFWLVYMHVATYRYTFRSRGMCHLMQVPESIL